MNNSRKKILIVGGGTAGWMVANLFATRWNDYEITLLESSDIGTIGVGEGSTPQLKLFFDAIGVDEKEWMPQCNATYKNGISFSNWSAVPGYEQYFHPFPAQTDGYTTPVFFNNIQARLQGYDVSAHPDSYFLSTYLTKQGLGPIAAETFPFDVAYGYHFDSGLLGKFLAKKSETKNVKRIIATLQNVHLHDNGEIKSVSLDDGTQLEADFFVDCTGFSSLLLQKSLGVKFNPFKENLFNDAAVVMPSPIADKIVPETKSTALSNGWAWKIPLTSRYGNGYVYSSAYISADQAETELRSHLGLLDGDTSARHLKMKVGRVDKHWTKNCLGVGLSQGFIEPLEATALYLVFETVYKFMKYYESGSFSNQFESVFNNEINEKFEGVRDYIVCHYKVNQRRDTDYWLDNAKNNIMSENLARVIGLWRNSENFVKDMHAYKLEGSYQAESWACLLSGYGYFPALNPKLSNGQDVARHDLNKLADFIRRCGLNFKDHNDLL
jgi:hypothetical protein